MCAGVVVLAIYLPLLLLLISMVSVLDRQQQQEKQPQFTFSNSHYNNFNLFFSSSSSSLLETKNIEDSPARAVEEGKLSAPAWSFQEAQPFRRMFATTTTTTEHRNEDASLSESSSVHTMMLYDVAIVGAGPAGLTAALFAARAGLSTLVLGSRAGLLSETPSLDNFPSWWGFHNNDNNMGDKSPKSGIIDAFGSGSGIQWLQQTRQQALALGVQLAPPGLLVERLQPHNNTIGHRQAPRKLIDTRTSTTSSSPYFELQTARKDYSVWSRSVIVATGATPRRLNLPYEAEFLWGRSIHNCPICDGPMYSQNRNHQTPSATQLTTTSTTTTTTSKGHDLLVVGGGDAALDAALYLAQLWEHNRVVLVHRRTEFRTSPHSTLWKLIKEMPNIEIRTPYVVTEWLVKNDASLAANTDQSKVNVTLVGARLQKQQESAEQQRIHSGVRSSVKQDNTDDATMVVPCQGVFLMIGATPNTQWLSSALDLDAKSGLVKLHNSHSSGGTMGDMETIRTTTQTSLPGVFAAGEVTDSLYKQAITAASAGAQAALDAERWLRQQPKITIHGLRTPWSPSTTTTKDPPKKQQQEERTPRRQAKNAQPDQDECDLTAEDCISSIVRKYHVVVFSKRWCPFCHMALESLSLAGWNDPHVIDLSKHHDAWGVQATLQKMTGRRTVPNVFVDGQSIGGGEETATLQRHGQLRPLLEKSSTRQENEVDQDNKEEVQQCDLSLDGCMLSIVNKYPLVVFSSATCAECQKLLELLRGMVQVSKPHLHVVELGPHYNISPAIRNQLRRQASSASVPSLFVGGQSIGGYNAASKLFHNGELIPMLKKAGVELDEEGRLSV
ncbi:hypothetical protein ACA910_022025 [Epithemia clementina (nom. ined.)]